MAVEEEPQHSAVAAVAELLHLGAEAEATMMLPAPQRSVAELAERQHSTAGNTVRIYGRSALYACLFLEKVGVWALDGAYAA